MYCINIMQFRCNRPTSSGCGVCEYDEMIINEIPIYADWVMLMNGNDNGDKKWC